MRAGGVLDVRHQPADVLGLLGLHQRQQRGGGLGRQVGDQVGGVVGRHLLEDVGGALGVEVLEDLDLVLLGQLLEDVGEPLVVERGDDGAYGAPAAGRGACWPRRRGRISLSAAIRWVAPWDSSRLGQPLDVAPLDRRGSGRAGAGPWRAPGWRPGSAPSRGCGPAPSPRRRPCRRRRCSGSCTVRSSIWPITSVSVGPLLEAAHVEQPGRVDLPAVDVGHPGHRHEDPAPAEDLGHQAEHARLLDLGADRHDEVAHLADLVALGVEDRQPDEAGHVDAGGGGAHVRTRYRPPRVRGAGAGAPDAGSAAVALRCWLVNRWNPPASVRISRNPQVRGASRRCGAR